MAPKLKAPFPAFGGKSKVAPLVWQRIGDVANAIEPFCNSAAWLLARPTEPRIETINDANCYVANFWRATQQDPEGVVEFADGPVNEADLHARHRWLVLSNDAAEFRNRMRTDPNYFDTRVAGWWVWGSCCWIGTGWCDTPESQAIPHISDPNGCGIHSVEKRPRLSGRSERDADIGVHKNSLSQQIHRLSDAVGIGSAPQELSQKIPVLNPGGNTVGTPGKGIHGSNDANHDKRPRVAARDEAGTGLQRPQLADQFARGRGIHGNDSAGNCDNRRAWLLDWFGALRDRLRTVRVCCGDWQRVCDSVSVTTRLGTTGIFLDPPYPTHAPDGSESRSTGLYSGDDRDALDVLRDRVLAYCIDRGNDHQFRIAVCGYDTDGYAALEPLGWECIAWKASGGYGNQRGSVNANAGRERIWFSPHCVKNGSKSLFD